MNRNDLFFMGALVAAAGALSWALNELTEDGEAAPAEQKRPEREVQLEVVARRVTHCPVPPGLKRRQR